ncbi:TIGR01777 family oxidoreductase [Bowmanella yangjiangensis]|uniref:TIGR01777 family oxidoreductase n=1 Tax=Bowmanella yangjiangensis TaxID=2811230 RepID=A0ABS3CU07_9ALTE|nr:TIGR01777 family oxidoreductase [Bowmanella yangjiangensis]MBN7819911.1 TIGR01777 family oxidoreductase [Bowmanella yangjiangensis]
MQILMTGGTGLIGTRLLSRLPEGYHVTVLTRNLAEAELALGRRATWISSFNELPNLDGFDAVINLAGEPIADKRWSKEQKDRICQSRWQITEKLVDLCQRSQTPPKVFLSGSAVGYYGRQDEELISEYHRTPHDEFSHQLCHRWEQIALQAQSEHTRVCLLRTGIVLSRKGGALIKMLPAFRAGLGGRMGDGRQFMSWIHISDMMAAIRFLLETPDCQGPYNLTAPNPVTNQEFSETLASVLGRPCLFPMPGFVLKMLFGDMSELLLTGQRVIPTRLEEAGFHFQFQHLKPALENLLKS